MFRLKCHQPHETKAKFYIQSKGEHSGRPLKIPIPNCFSVYTEIENLQNLVYALYVGGLFKPFISGSVVPFIRIDDTKELINKHINLKSKVDLFEKIEKIDLLKSSLKAQLNLIDELQRTLCIKALQGK